MNTHRVEVFNRADDDAVVVLVAHHFHLVLFPAEDGLLNQQLMRRRRIKTAFANCQKFVFIVGNAAARTAHGKRRTNQRREADLFLRCQSLVHGVADKRFRARQTDFFHRFFKAATVFRLVNRVFGRTDQLDVVFRQHAVARQIQRTVQRGLAAHRGQNRIRPLLGDNLLHRLPHNRLDVGNIRHFRVGHDRGGVGIHQNDFIAFFTQSLTGLCARIVKFAGLTDNDRAGADDKDGF